jgi:Protein of unknown function (DUF2971)
MGALDEFLTTLPNTFDFNSIIDPDVAAIESDAYTKSIIYKYFPAARRGFFQKPQVRFSPREALNDPFEMTRRWREASADGLKAYVKEMLTASLPAIISNPDLLTSMLAEQFTTEGKILTATQKTIVDQFFETMAGKEFLTRQLTVAQGLAPVMLETCFVKMQSEFDQTVENIVSSMGILSLTGDALNDRMWRRYGDGGAGFVVGLDPTNRFFMHNDGLAERSLLKRLIYSDQNTENFWKNPYYLFLVKDTTWSYESEWRMIRQFADSDEAILNVTPQVHLWNIPPEAIKTIHFGQSYDRANIPVDKINLQKAGANPILYRIVIDTAGGGPKAENI